MPIRDVRMWRSCWCSTEQGPEAQSAFLGDVIIIFIIITFTKLTLSPELVLQEGLSELKWIRIFFYQTPKTNADPGGYIFRTLMDFSR